MPVPNTPCLLCRFKIGDLSESLAAFTEDSHSDEIRALLRSNEQSTDSQTSEIRALIAEAERDVAALDDKIMATRDKLQGLITRRFQKKRKLDDYEQLRRPIRRLPHDCLSEIFSAVVDGDKDFAKNSLDTRRGMPWIVARVCSKWRSVAKAHPMWTRISLDISQKKITQGAPLLHHLFALSEQCYRAEDRPLSVSINMSIFVSKFNTLFPGLIQTSPRWETLSLSTMLSNCENILQIRGSLQSLTRLHLDIVTSSGDPAQKDVCATSLLPKIFEFVPKLNSLSGDSDTLLGCGLPVSQIRHYRCLGPASSRAVKSVLKGMPNLEFCVFGGLISANPGPLGIVQTPAAISHYNLRCLIIDASFIEIQYQLNLPSVKRFIVTGPVKLAKTLEFLLNAKIYTLDEIRLWDTYIRPEELSLLFKHFSALEILETGIDGVMDLDLLNVEATKFLTSLKLTLKNALQYDLAALGRLRELRPSLTFSSGTLR
ncbi:hypothetical protein C8J56DRAFT_2990 [Mycena floridula]|nr:hypothetical protein C8J56DRAFT_2990 [Mycena floridula]